MPARALTITVGLPGSGKSAWTHDQVMANRPGQVARVNRDDLRAMMHAGRYAGSDTENAISAGELALARAAFEMGATWVIADDTNLHPHVIHQWYDLARDLRAEFTVRSFLDVPVETCIRRDARRRGGAHVGDKRIRTMAQAHADQAGYCVALVQSRANPFEQEWTP